MLLKFFAPVHVKFHYFFLHVFTESPVVVKPVQQVKMRIPDYAHGHFRESRVPEKFFHVVRHERDARFFERKYFFKISLEAGMRWHPFLQYELSAFLEYPKAFLRGF